MQDDLFGAPTTPLSAPLSIRSQVPDTDCVLVNEGSVSHTRRQHASEVLPLPPDEATRALASNLNPRIRLGASTWSYPGRAGIVWDEGPDSEAVLAKNGLAAYARYPLLRCVGIDRSFYRPLTEAQYARYAGQVPADFRFVV